MNPTIRYFLIAATVLAIFAPAITTAQTPSPSPPFVAKNGPDPGKWSIAFNYSTKDPSARPTARAVMGQRITRLDVTKTGDLKQETASFIGGASIDAWFQGGAMVLKDPGYEHKIVRRNEPSGGDFPEFKWITSDSFQGTKEAEGKICDVFKSDFYALQFADPGLYSAALAQGADIDLGSKMPVVAYIDQSTKLPVKLTIGDDSRVYTFAPGPGTPLIMPQDYLDAVGDVQKRYEALTRPLSRP